MKKNILLLLLACSFGFSNIKGMMEGYEYEDDAFSENGGSSTDDTYVDTTTTPDAVKDSATIHNSDASTDLQNDGEGNTVVDQDTATNAGSLADRLNDPGSGVVEVEVDDDDYVDTNADDMEEIDLGEDESKSDESSANLNSLLNADGEIDPTELQEMFEDKISTAMDGEKSIWSSILDFFKEIAEFFGKDNMDQMLDTINSAFKKSIVNIDGAFDQLGKELKEEADTIKQALNEVSSNIKNAFKNAMKNTNSEWVGYFDTPQEL